MSPINIPNIFTPNNARHMNYEVGISHHVDWKKLISYLAIRDFKTTLKKIDIYSIKRYILVYNLISSKQHSILSKESVRRLVFNRLSYKKYFTIFYKIISSLNMKSYLDCYNINRGHYNTGLIDWFKFNLKLNSTIVLINWYFIFSYKIDWIMC